MDLYKQEVVHDAISGPELSSGDPPRTNETSEAAARKKEPGDSGEVKQRRELLAPDERRANAQRVAKTRWATWASSKTR